MESSQMYSIITMYVCVCDSDKDVKMWQGGGESP